MDSTLVYKPRFKTTCVEIAFSIDFNSNIDSADNILFNSMSKILSYLKQNVNDNQKVGFSFSLPSLPEVKPFGIKLSFMKELSADLIVDIFSTVNQSNSSFSSNNIMKLKILIVDLPYGHGKRCVTKNLIISDIFKHKRSLIQVVTKKFDCLPRALILAKCLADRNLTLLSKLLKNEEEFLHEVKILSKLAKVKISCTGNTIADVYKFHSVLSNYCIIIYGSTTDSNCFFFRSNNISIQFKPLFLICIEHSFHTLKSPKGFFNKNYSCEHCYTLYNNDHLCRHICQYCRSHPPCQYNLNSTKLSCKSCRVEFLNFHCYEMHKTNKYGKSNVCNNINYCIKCCKTIDLLKRNAPMHVCNEKYCESCRQLVNFEHKCYIQQYKKKVSKSFTIIFFDFESELKFNPITSVTEHLPNLCVACEVCNLCYSVDDKNFKCINCVERYKIFWTDDNSNCVVKLISLVRKYRKYTNQVTCIAHNGKMYDNVFVLDELIKQKIDINPILNGSKIMQITGSGFRFIDSINFIPMALSKFPKCFGMKKDIQKGYYPYKFNTRENINYSGPYPSIDHYGIDTMSVQEKVTFLDWYSKIPQNSIFNNKTELLNYCILDVEILSSGCIKFMIDFLNATKISVFLEAMTLANSVMLAFRKNFLIPDTIACITSNYTNQSKIANQWLIYQNKLANGQIKFNSCYGEYRLPQTGIMVDGFDPITQTVYQFWGCYWHGHIKCQKDRLSYCKRFKNNPDNRYSDTLKQIERIKTNGYKLIDIWECDFISFLRCNPLIKKQITEDPTYLFTPIDPRDSVYGGRVEVFKLYHKVLESNEKIRYLDFTSLYPFVNKNFSYPKGHPKITFGEQCKKIDLKNSHGIIKCKILPPKKLFLPVLPVKLNGRLLFTLCNTCASKLNMSTCIHNDNERSICGTWVIAEVNKAISLNYSIIEIFEIWTFDVVKGDNGLFTKYVNHFLKSKQECSDWPANCTSKLQKEAYIKSYEDHEGIALDSSKISDNPGLRNLSKLCLNSLWGKMIQGENYSQSKILHKEEDFFKIICDDSIEINDMVFFNENDSVLLEYKFKDNLNKPSPNINVIIGSFTTCYARLILFDLMYQLGERILYADTDSVIFIESDDSHPKPQVGSFLGELTDECQSYGEGAYIEEFVASGCKSYALKIFSPRSNDYAYNIKSKGITINSSTSDLVNFNSLKSMVCDENDCGYRIVTHTRFKRLKTLQIINQIESKNLKFTYTKRICKDDLFTVPYGY